MSWHETVQSVDRFWPMDWLLCRTARPHPGKPSSSRQRAPTSSPLLGRNHVGLSVSLQLTKCHETLRSLTGTMTRCCHNVTATKPWKTSVLHTKNVIPTHWAGADLNRRHTDFQSVALPTELPALMLSRWANHPRAASLAKHHKRSLYIAARCAALRRCFVKDPPSSRISCCGIYRVSSRPRRM